MNNGVLLALVSSHKCNSTVLRKCHVVVSHSSQSVTLCTNGKSALRASRPRCFSKNDRDDNRILYQVSSGSKIGKELKNSRRCLFPETPRMSLRVENQKLILNFYS